ncbi:hypothetical protein [Streptomyces formicae]|uniref:DUF5050 domain-containing protein n=1 Tax=Streptomyces formicae TaxID=1616117 RepID=A0ABY3WMZ4_9ACTN|nr:hypothetical protein [Streptomyces formicae]UNM13035.1 hypothetical protein J4032_17350 [Streptomyces formicae]
MAASGEEIRISLEGGRIPAPSGLAVNKNNELTWESSGAGEQTGFLLTFFGNVSKREVTAAAGTTKAAIPTDLAETRYLVEARAVKNGNYSPPTAALKISIKLSSAPEDLKIGGLDEPQGIATYGKGLYIANQHSGKIIQADMDGKNAKTAIDKLETPMGIATNGQLFWVATQGSGGAVTGYSTDNPCSKFNEPVKGKPGVNYLSYFSSDIHRYSEKYSDPLLFTSQGKGWAAWGYLTGSCGEILSDLGDLRGMTFDGEFLYIASRDRGKVIRARVDGTGGKEDFITVAKPEDITWNARHLYVTSDDGRLIRASRLTGAIDQSFTISNLNKPRGVQVWGNYVYFVEQGDNRVSRVFVGWAVE